MKPVPLMRFHDVTFKSRDLDRFVKSPFLPDMRDNMRILYKAWKLIEAATNHKWLNSSFIRASPSHARGQAIDLYPDMTDELKARYSGTKGSDPVLHSRTELYNRLLPLSTVEIAPNCQIIIGVESDHLHVQVLPPGAKGPLPTVIWQWKQPKTCYRDTYERQDRQF